MAEGFKYVPHPHIEARKKAGAPSTVEVRKHLHGDSAAARFNARFGLLITNSVGTMWCAYLFAVIGIMGITGALTNNVNLVLLVGAISGYVLQLVLLPVIIVGQNVQAKASDARAEATYKDAEAVLHEAKQIQAHLQTQDEILSALVDKLQDALTKARTPRKASGA
jgi:uncharacterized membrane protein YcjF (UPF0283 family)